MKIAFNPLRYAVQEIARNVIVKGVMSGASRSEIWGTLGGINAQYLQGLFNQDFNAAQRIYGITSRLQDLPDNKRIPASAQLEVGWHQPTRYKYVGRVWTTNRETGEQTADYFTLFRESNVSKATAGAEIGAAYTAGGYKSDDTDVTEVEIVQVFCA